MYTVEVGFFIIFLMLWKNHELVKWIFIFLGGLLLTPFFGRFYCGWICPINTTFKPISIVYKMFKIKRFKTPKILESKTLRLVFVFSFIALFLITKFLKIKLNIILYVVGIGAFITLFFEENLWHKHICPYGTILSIPSIKPLKKLNINQDKCVGCGLCQTVCPTKTIITLPNNKREIKIKECLMCFECQRVCPVDAISMKKTK